MNPRAFVLALSLLALSGAEGRAQRPDSSGADAELVRRSGFIFQGTVKELGAATPTVVREPNTIIVHVDGVLEALPPIGNVRGRDVTVRMRSATQLRPGASATFFTYVYSAGTSLGLQEVGVRPVEDTVRTIRRIRSARATLSDERLARRLATARLVVLGSVGEARPAEGSEEHRGEHDPLWWRVPIRVATTLKGAARDATVFANYAHSDDPAWERSPKPKTGDRGIFLLQPARGSQFRAPGLFLVDSLDVLDGGQLERVRRLLRSAR